MSGGFLNHICPNCKDEIRVPNDYPNGLIACQSCKIYLYPGRKDDSGKLYMDLLPFDALESIAAVLTFGAEKYSPDNWKVVPDAIPRYEAALLRHFSAYKQGDKTDPETGLSHLAHAACNALFLIWFELQKEYSGDAGHDGQYSDPGEYIQAK